MEEKIRKLIVILGGGMISIICVCATLINLSNINDLQCKDTIRTSQEGEENNKKVKNINYKDRVEHIFFHPLVAYNKRAFDGDYQAQGMDDWFVTVKEFKLIIEKLYENNFILVNINDVYKEIDKNGKNIIVRNDLMIPEGKKPIIISIDDMNYYEYMIKDGTVSKLIIDKDGDIASVSKGYDGKKLVSKDNAIVPILNNFVKENPNFSLNGAKGTIALTGYEGILGYRTNRQNKNKEHEIQEAKKIVSKLKENGWNFASHSYGHPNIQEISLDKLKDDTTKWKNEVESIIGKTEIYIYPYGDGLKSTDKRFKYLQTQGFKIFCSVGTSSYEELLNTNAVITDRRHSDGISLREQRKEFLDLYDSKEILDIKGREGIY